MKTAIKRALARASIEARRPHGLSVDALEGVHVEPDREAWSDSVYLYGRDRDGTALTTQLAIRTRAPAEVWFSLRLPGQAIAFVDPMEHPATGSRQAGGLRFEVAEPGRRWEVSYGGPLRQGDRQVACEAELTFRSTAPLVDFSQGIDPTALSRALAAEPWSRRFFSRLGEIRTVHYEQAGRLTGTVTLDGVAHRLDVASLRDHSFGPRRWSAWSRHFWLSGVCEDGRAFTATRIRYDFLGPLVAGFLLGDEVVGIDETSGFDALGPIGRIPRRAELELWTRGGARHRLTMRTDDVFELDMGQGAYALREAIATYELDGVEAVGIAELGWAR